MNSLLIYGANGYSAKLILNELLKFNIKPILAGRNKKEIIEIAENYKLDYKIFDLENFELIVENLKGIHTLINCAGPFIFTAKELIEACLITKTNYLDITGEIPVLSLAYKYSEKAKENNITILPAVGFDIIPTDCLAKKLKEKYPNAYELKLSLITINSKISRGTLLTSIEFLSGKSKILKDGKIIESTIGEYKNEVIIEGKKYYTISIPWGDVFTANISTEIKNVSVYLSVPYFVYKNIKLILCFNTLLKIKFIKSIVKLFVKKFKYGPNDAERKKSFVIIHGKVIDEQKNEFEDFIKVKDGYEITALGASLSAKKVLSNEVPKGFLTPSLAFGSEFVNNFIVE
ncbi:MAG: saccharopine dehydrogenase NADP-binding domain-containing protein [Melioribacteraceae bacterium]|nr:saccharopine dehydrogenase NADP-binding domain-containing protein [Melioribacteraceae bacterium]